MKQMSYSAESAKDELVSASSHLQQILFGHVQKFKFGSEAREELRFPPKWKYAYVDLTGQK